MSEQQSKKQKKIKKAILSPAIKKQPTLKQQKEVKVENTPKENTKKPTSIHQLPTIQNMLEIPEQAKAQKSLEYFEKVKPFLLQFMQKKQGSRVLHLMFKWSGDQVKKLIHKCILTNWKELIRSNALYLLQKISKQVDFPGCLEDALLLQNSIQGAKILQNYGEKCDENMKAIKDKIYELWEKSKENDIKSQQKLHNLALKAIEKQFDYLPLSKLLIRLSVFSMFEEEKKKVLEYYVGKELDWISDEEGVRLFIEIVNLSDSKAKKLIVRHFKGKVQEIVQQHSVAYVALIKILTEVDDTKLIQNALLTQVQGLLPLMNEHKHAFSVIFSLFSPRNNNFNVLGKYEHTVRYTQCKKQEEKRKTEIRLCLAEKLVQFLDGDNLYHLLRHPINSKLVVGLYKSLQEDSQTDLYNKFVQRIAKLYLSDAKDSIKGNIFTESLCAHQSANKIIKSILWLQDENIDGFCDEFAKLILKNLELFINSKAGFVLLALIQKGGRDYIITEIKRARVVLVGSPICQILQNLLKKKK